MRTADRRLKHADRPCPSCRTQMSKVVHTVCEGARAVPCGCRVSVWFDLSGVVNVRSVG